MTEDTFRYSGKDNLDAGRSPDRAETVLLVADEVRVWRGV